MQEQHSQLWQSSWSFWVDLIFSSRVSLFPFLWGQLMSWLQLGHPVVNFFYLMGVSVHTKQLKNMAQKIINSTWTGTKGPRICIRTLLLFGPLWLSLLLHFLISLLHLSTDQRFSTGKRQLEDMEGKIIQSCSMSSWHQPISVSGLFSILLVSSSTPPWQAEFFSQPFLPLSFIKNVC